MRSGLLSHVAILACRTHHSRWLAAAVLSGGLISPAMAQEITPQLGQAQEIRRSEAGKVQFYSRTGQEYESVPTLKMDGQAGLPGQPVGNETPQPYQRTGSQTPLKNYHAELFGTPATKSAGTVQTIPTTASQTPVQILNAEYQAIEGQTATPNVVTVGGTAEVPQSAELPEWARDMKSRNLFELKPAVTAEVTPASATEPQLSITDHHAAPESADAAADTAAVDTAPAAAPEMVEISQAQLGTIAAGPQTPSVKVEWKSRSEINLGQECECELQVANVSSSIAYGVTIAARFPAGVQLLEMNPQPTSVSGDQLLWSLGTMQAEQAQTIKVKFIPKERGALAATAQVHFSGIAQSGFVVREPLLNLAVEGPEQVLIGDPASQNVTISNPGNGIAKNVRLEAVISAGLEHTRGERLIMDVGTLTPGEARTIRLALAAIGGGNQVVQLTATADGGLLQAGQASINVIAPSLQTEISGPGLRYKGRSAVYTLQVTNDGTVATSNVRLMHKIPEGFRFLNASRGASYDSPTRILSWFVGKLEAGGTAEMQVELNADQIGDFTHYIRATSEHGSMTDSQLVTRVEGASALMLEITDLDDPVEVGSETAYEIKIVNNGSAAASDVGLTCELPEGVRFLKAEGPSQHVADGNVVLFQPLTKIEAGKSAVYRVHVVGTIDGNLRFRARMTSATSKEPLTLEELTRFYGDQR